jgi:uncharacterized protein
MIIDFHTHAFPDAIAAYAISSLEGKSRVKSAGNGTLRDLSASMDRSGVDRSVVCPVSTKVSQVRSINQWIGSVTDPRLIPFGTLFPGMDDPAGETAWLRENGIRGVKLHPEYQDFYVDDESVYPLYEACMKDGLIVLFHAGVDIGLPPPVHATPERLARVLDDFPGLTVVAAHLGGYRMWDGVREHLVGRSIYFDLAYFSVSYDEALFLSIMRSHGIERILFATDYPWLDQVRALEEITAWPFSGDERRMVMGENAKRLLGLTG